jgi:hypothetical protein
MWPEENYIDMVTDPGLGRRLNVFVIVGHEILEKASGGCDYVLELLTLAY